MRTCPVHTLLRGAKQPERAENSHATTSGADAPVDSNACRCLAVSITLLGWIGGRSLADLLSAIPSSNDDFGLF